MEIGEVDLSQQMLEDGNVVEDEKTQTTVGDEGYIEEDDIKEDCAEIPENVSLLGIEDSEDIENFKSNIFKNIGTLSCALESRLQGGCNLSKLEINIERAIVDFDNIKRAIEEKGVHVGHVPTSEYAEKISLIQYEESSDFAQEMLSLNTTNLTIPLGVTQIRPYAFYRFSSLVNVVLPEGITNTGDNSFRYCSNLQNIHFPSTLTTIGEYSFNNCISLKSAILPHGINRINGFSFVDCEDLQTLHLPNTLTSTGTTPFKGCANLEFLTLEEGYNFNGLDLSSGTKYSVETLVGCFNALKDRKGLSSYKFIIGSVNIAKLSPEEIEIATAKNWTLQ